MVGAILGVVFKDEDGCVAPVRRVTDDIDDSADGIVVVRYLQCWRPKSGDGSTETTVVVVGQAKQGEVRQSVDSHISLPLVDEVRISVVLVESAEVHVGLAEKGRLFFDRLRNLRIKWSRRNGDVGGDLGISFGRVTAAADVVDLIEEEPVIAHRFARSQGGIP